MIDYVDNVFIEKVLLKVVVGCSSKVWNASSCVVIEYVDDVLIGKVLLKIIAGCYFQSGHALQDV